MEFYSLPCVSVSAFTGFCLNIDNVIILMMLATECGQMEKLHTEMGYMQAGLPGHSREVQFESFWGGMSDWMCWRRAKACTDRSGNRWLEAVTTLSQASAQLTSSWSARGVVSSRSAILPDVGGAVCFFHNSFTVTTPPPHAFLESPPFGIGHLDTNASRNSINRGLFSIIASSLSPSSLYTLSCDTFFITSSNLLRVHLIPASRTYLLLHNDVTSASWYSNMSYCKRSQIIQYTFEPFIDSRF